MSHHMHIQVQGAHMLRQQQMMSCVPIMSITKLHHGLSSGWDLFLRPIRPTSLRCAQMASTTEHGLSVRLRQTLLSGWTDDRAQAAAGFALDVGWHVLRVLCVSGQGLQNQNWMVSLHLTTVDVKLYVCCHQWAPTLPARSESACESGRRWSWQILRHPNDKLACTVLKVFLQWDSKQKKACVPISVGTPYTLPHSCMQRR